MSAIGDIGIKLMLAFAQLILGIVLAMGSVYLSLKLFDKFTRNFDEWKEIKKGNVAVGILFGGIIFSIAIILEIGITPFMDLIVSGTALDVTVNVFAIGIINLLISIVAAVMSVYIAIRVLDWITVDIDEMAELKKGNVAVAIMMVAVLLAVSFIIRGAVKGIIDVVNAVQLLRLVSP